MGRKTARLFLSGILLLAASLAVSCSRDRDSSRNGELRLADVFQSHMVLQRDMEVPVWGWTEPGAAVKVTVGGREASTRADEKGKWMVKVGPLAPGGPYELTVEGPGGKIRLEDVLAGDVWVASGQSNMDFLLEEAKNAEEEISRARYPRIRLLRVGKMVGTEPFDFLSGGTWKPCNPDTAKEFSAVAYFFGRKLHEELRVPIGLIHTAWGGTCVEAWTPLEDLEACKAAAPIFGWWRSIMKSFPQRLKKFQEVHGRWKEAAARAKEEGRPLPEEPYPPLGPGHDHQPAGLYNAMVHPLVPFGIKGVIWYQGEANVGRARQYKTLFPLLIRSWRKAWGQGPFPFLFVQLAGFGKWDYKLWPWLREAQEAALELPETGMATAVDIGEKDNIHPRNKQDVGLRLALVALARVYGKKIEYSGPRFESMRVEGSRALISFTHVDGGLVSKTGPNLAGFVVAGEDRIFHPARARIEGGCVVVTSPKVSRPSAVRYAWAGFPACSLYNRAGLPAPPFRTDAWPAPPDRPCSYPLRYAVTRRDTARTVPAASRKKAGH